MFDESDLSEEAQRAQRIQENYDNSTSEMARSRNFFVSVNCIGNVNILF